jgi:hypothetical protein
MRGSDERPRPSRYPVGDSSRPAARTASARERTPSLRWMFLMWLETVSSETTSASAIPWVLPVVSAPRIPPLEIRRGEALRGARQGPTCNSLDECPRCRADVLGLRGLAIVAPPPLLPLAVAGAVAGAGAGPVKRRRPPRSQAMAAAAAAAAVLGRRGGCDRAHARIVRRRAGRRVGAVGVGPCSLLAGTGRIARPGGIARREAEAERGAEPRRETEAGAPAAPRAGAGAGAPPAPTPEPVPVSTPAAPAPTPAAATPEPAVLDDGVQEFGVER